MYDMKNGTIWLIGFSDTKQKPNVAFLKSLSVHVYIKTAFIKKLKQPTTTPRPFEFRHKPIVLLKKNKALNRYTVIYQ